MKPLAALELLGSSRVIWIDDHFAEKSAEQLGALLSLELEVSRQCNFALLVDLYDQIDDGDDDAVVELKQRLSAMTTAERSAIEKEFVAKQIELGAFATDDLSVNQIKAVCGHLNIVETDCWPFEGAEDKIQVLCAANDSHVSYIVDLNDFYGAHGNTRGLDIFRALHRNSSKGTAFLLTHEASAATEATIEIQLRAELSAENSAHDATPICVIAKERLEGDSETTVADGLRTAIKRAGLRRGIHEVLIKARTEIVGAFDTAMSTLLTIPPEQLDEYVVGRAVAEGVSELHVVERALTATMSESIRRMFATDPQAQQSASRLRALRAVSLPNPASPHIQLEEFRKKELWEPGDLVNQSYAALACGDVFEFAGDEGVTDARRFILLVQPCDVMIRPRGERDSESGFLVPLKIKEGAGRDSLKQPALPFLLDGAQWVCDFRAATSVRLDTLDLATMRSDGKVRFDTGQTMPTIMLPGQEKIGKKLLKRMQEALVYRALLKNPDKNLFDGRCTLTLASSGVFKELSQPLFVDSSPKPVPRPATARRDQARSSATTQRAANDGDGLGYAIAKAPKSDAHPTVETSPEVAVRVAEAIYLEIPAPSLGEAFQAPEQNSGVANQAEVSKDASEALVYFSWRIRRCGRVRMPFAASLLNSYLAMMGREAFDLDYLKPSGQECQAECAVQTVAQTDAATAA